MKQQKSNVTRQQTWIFELTHEAYVPASRTESPTDFLSLIHALHTVSTLDIPKSIITDIL